ncbi:MAG: MBL fold metallo-hydrolase [Chloroflexi bacterium]|nr:MBL fold metallo-hydrolase [Chloroflexota bacterium]
MLLKYFYDKKLAQASYMVGCAATGEALIVDPARDIAQYIEAAEAEGLRITHVTETHIHADFVSGSRELAAATGATLYLSDAGDADWKYAFADENAGLVGEGDTWMVGNVRVDVLHTPGHTPEHLAFLITDTAAADEPIGVFTGDFLFVGDIGRPDLLEEAAGIAGTKEAGARLQFESVQRIKALPDYLQVWPGHGAGSACGKALGAIPSTTLGYEKRFNPAFQIDDEDSFVEWLLEGQPEAPRYFAQMKKVNKLGPAPLSELTAPRQLDRAALDTVLASDELVIDMRDMEAFAASHRPKTVNIPVNSGGFNTYVGWFVDYERPLYFIAPGLPQVDEILGALRAIGVDNVGGYWAPEVVGDADARLHLMTAQELSQRIGTDNPVIIDVRGRSEFTSRHIVGATNIPLGYLPRHLNQLPRDRMIVMNCASGFRSQIGASLLRRYGFENVTNLNAGPEEWESILQTSAS